MKVERAHRPRETVARSSRRNGATPDDHDSNRQAAALAQYSVRPAREQDCVELTRLAGQLEYPASNVAMRKRLERLLTSSKDAIFVAEQADGGLMGWIHGVLSQALESDYRVEIAGLIVDDRFQRMGVGRALVKRVERWANEQGIGQVLVRCRTSRTGAHRFYKNLGFNPAKTQIVFRKKLARRRGNA